MFFGENIYMMDKAKRISIPQRFLKELGGVGAEVIVTKCSDGCIYLCPPENWEEVKKELEEPIYPAMVQIKSRGRILLSKDLREYAGLEREVVMVGYGDHIEFWNEKRWIVAKEEAEKEGIAIL